MASADSDVIRWRRLQISELHPLKVLRLWHKCLTPLQKAPLWSLSRGEVLQLLPYLDCLKSVKQSSITSEINSCWPFLQVNSKPPLSSSDSVSSPCNKSPLVRFQCEASPWARLVFEHYRNHSYRDFLNKLSLSEAGTGTVRGWNFDGQLPKSWGDLLDWSRHFW